MPDASIAQQYTSAVDALVSLLGQDRRVLAAILCGSLAHDVVWTGSDVDLVVIVEDDLQDRLRSGGMSLNANGVNVHAIQLTRTAFRAAVEGALRHSFMHSFLAKGRLLYTRDPTIGDLFARLTVDGDRDRAIQMLRAASAALPALYKAHKWFVTRGDLEYTALYLLHAAGPFADVEVLSAGQLVDRESLPRALALNPRFFDIVYRSLLNQRKTRERVEAALHAADGYLQDRSQLLFAPILDYLREAGEARTCSEIDAHFKRHFDIGEACGACEYLADQGLLMKVAVPRRLTRKSTVQLPELAFLFVDRADAEGGAADAGLGPL
jgi:hypothetical protein